MLNRGLQSKANNENHLIISILDPESKLLPFEARVSSNEAFSISRSFCYDIFNKREKFYEINTETVHKSFNINVHYACSLSIVYSVILLVVMLVMRMKKCYEGKITQTPISMSVTPNI